jgi:HD-like signal output (HDOD) protein
MERTRIHDRRVLFVDDEPNVLSGLRRMLHPMRHEWNMHFAHGGADALKALAEAPFDIVVADMRMPGIDGAALLEEVSRTHPRIMRIVLSGQANREAVLRGVGAAHQYLSKPCDAEEIRGRLERLFALRDLLPNDDLKSAVGRLRSLPSAPGVGRDLAVALGPESGSLGRLVRVAERDLAITTKLLHWVNSGFFGTYAHVGSAEQALRLLGLDVVRALLSSVPVNEVDPGDCRDFQLEGVWTRGAEMRRAVIGIATLEGVSSETLAHAATAAMFVDVGRLVLASCIPDQYREIVAEASRSGRPLAQLEREALGCGHGDVGAYLLGLWGLPQEVTNLVAGYHQPTAAAPVTPRTIVQAAMIQGVPDAPAPQARKPQRRCAS